ncbi:uncharacterized protein [Parasteatoda tepidariorum]|uniref:uncharacterized protein n=1 Tax=Parasteatoda tepidariorum TaxID=114398 RepID=UPI001C71ED1A|nr:uncharacterized protein DDB_G0283357 [Parasteatoda tepidariorum]
MWISSVASQDTMDFNWLNMKALCIMVCVGFLLLDATSAQSSISKTKVGAKNENITDIDNLNSNQTISRRQDGGFDLVSYFLNGNPVAQQSQQQQSQQTQQAAPSQQYLTIQQQHQLQQHLLQQQQQQQQDQLKQLQIQQLQQLQQPRSVDLNYQNNLVQQYQPQQNVPSSREGGIGIQLGLGNGYQSGGGGIGNGYQSGGGVGIGNGYQGGNNYAGGQQGKEIAIQIGAGKPITSVGGLISLLPRIFKVLTAGGKVMFGVELGNNFYFGPVGAKPLVKLG